MQSEMFDAAPRARRSDPLTSHLAAASASKFAGTHQMQLLRALRDSGPATVDRLSLITRLTSWQISRRMSELQRLGLARPTGRTEPSFSGCAQRVWEAV